MKCRLRQIVVLLLLGAIINVAVAWGVAFIPADAPIEQDKRLIVYSQKVVITHVNVRMARLDLFRISRARSAHLHVGRKFLSEKQFRAMIPPGSAFYGNDPTRNQAWLHYREVLARWPAYALRGHTAMAKTLTSSTYGLFRLPQQDNSPGCWNEFPFIPIWPGFGINTVFYASIFWLLFAASGVIRRAVRRRRGDRAEPVDQERDNARPGRGGGSASIHSRNTLLIRPSGASDVLQPVPRVARLRRFTRGYIPLPLRGRHTRYDDVVKRWALRIFVFLLLGAIVNVAVAWGCAYFNELDADWPNVERTTTGEWSLVCVDRRFGSEEIRCCHRLSNEVDIENFREHPEHPWWERWWVRFGPFGTGEWGAAHGWPTYSLSSWRDWNPNAQLVQSYITLGGWNLPPRTRGELRIIPLTPLWPGFAINTLFYAGILWLMFAAPFALRRRRRIKRGLCPACAYPIGDSAVCTECGKTVAVKSVELARS